MKTVTDRYDAPNRRSENARALIDRRYARRVVLAQKGRGSYSRKWSRDNDRGED